MDEFINIYSFETHPIIQTVKLKPPELKTSRDEFLFDELYFHKKNNLSNQQLKLMFTRLCSEKPDFSCISQITQVDFLFNPYCLNRIVQNKDNSQLAMYYSLHAAICWCIHIQDHNFDKEDFSTLIKSLVQINSTFYSKIASYMLSYVIFIASPFIKEIDINKIIELLNNFIFSLSQHENLTEMVKPLYSSFICAIKILGVDGPLDPQSEELIQFITELQKVTDTKISTKQAVFLFNRCFDELKSLNLRCITYLDGFIDQIPWDEAVKFFGRFGYFCLKFIHQNNPEYVSQLLYQIKINKNQKETIHIPENKEVEIKKRRLLAFSTVQNIEKQPIPLPPSKRVTLQSHNKLSYNVNDVDESEVFYYQPLEEDPSVFRDMNLDFEHLEKPFTIPGVMATSMISHIFRDISPFSKNVKLIDPIFSSKVIHEIPKSFTQVERIIVFVQKLSNHYPQANLMVVKSFLHLLKNAFDMDLAFSLIIFLSKSTQETEEEKNLHFLNDILDNMEKIIFDPKCSIFVPIHLNNEENTEENKSSYEERVETMKKFLPYFQMRCLFFSILTYLKNFDMYSFMIKFIDYPLISGELFSYLTTSLLSHKKKHGRFSFFEKQPELNKNHEDICNLIATFLPSYINAFKNEETDNEIATSLNYIFNFYLNILIRPELTNSLLDQDYFVSLFVSLLFDENIRQKCLDIGIHLFRNADKTTIEQFSVLTASIFERFKLLSNLRELTLCNDLLKTSNDIMHSRNETLKHFANLKDQICIMFSSFQNNEHQEIVFDFILSILDYLTFISPVQWLSSSERKALYNIIMPRIEQSSAETHQVVFDKVAGLILGSNSNITTQAYIKQPRYILFFYSLFGEKAIDFILETFEYSHFNRLQAHIGKLDLELLNECERHPQILMNEKYFNLFTDIAEVASSSQVVYKFISLISQTQENKCISPYFMACIKALTQILSTKRKNPVCSIPLKNQDNFITVSNFNVQYDNNMNDLTLFIWLMFDYGSLRSSLLKVQTDLYELQVTMEKNELVLILTPYSSLLQYLIGKETSEVKKIIQVNMHPDDWTLVSFTFTKNNVQVRCNGDFHLFNFLQSKSTKQNDSSNQQNHNIIMEECQIGFDSDPIEHPVYLGPFSFAITNDSTIDDMYKKSNEIGPHSFVLPNYIMSVNIEMEDNFVKLENAFDTGPTFELSNHEIPATYNFSDTLIRTFTAPILIPLYAQISLVPKGEEKQIRIFIHETTKLFLTLFSVSRRSEYIFVDERSWQLVEFLLSNNAQYLGMNSYLLFLHIFKQSKNTQFQSQLLDTIIMNPSTWMETENETFLKITQSWCKDVLILCNFNVSFSHYFEKFLSQLWNNNQNLGNGSDTEITDEMKDFSDQFVGKSQKLTEKDKINQISIEKLNKIVSLPDIRRNCLLTLVHIAQNKFTDKDFKLIFSILFTTENKEVILSLLELLSFIASSISNPLSHLHGKWWKYFTHLIFLFQKEDDDISLNVISTFLSLYESKIFSPKMIDLHFEIFINILTKQKHSDHFFEAITQMTHKKAVVIQLCFALFASDPPKVTKWLHQHLEPDSKFRVTMAWSFWGVVAACECFKLNMIDEVKDLFRFILNCGNDRWEIIFMILSLISPSDQCTRIFVMEAATKIREAPSFVSQKHIQSFLDFSTLFIFYHSKDYIQKMFPKMFLKIQEEYKVDIFDYKRNCLGSPKKSSKIELSQGYSSSANSEGQNNEETPIEDQNSSIQYEQSFENEENEMNDDTSSDEEDEKEETIINNISGTKDLSSMNILEKLAPYTRPKQLYFSLEFDTNTLKWIDADLAKLMLEICTFAENKEYAKLGSILASFALLENQNDMDKIIPAFLSKFKPPDQYLQMLSKSLKKANLSLCVCPSTDVVLMDCLPDFIQSFDKKRVYYQYEIYRLNVFVQRQLNKSNKKKLSYLNPKQFKYLNYSLDIIKTKYHAQNQQIQKKWRLFWSSLTTECAPWFNKKNSNDNIQKYKRDITMCGLKSLTPQKMKINKKFDDHKEASIARDSGSQVFAQEMVRKYREEMLNPTSAQEDLMFYSATDTSINDSETLSTTTATTATDERDLGRGRVLFKDDAELVKIDSIKNVRFILLESSVVIFYVDTEQRDLIEAKNLRMILVRSFLHRKTGIEIFTTNGKSYLLHFLSQSPAILLRILNKHAVFYKRCRIQKTLSYKEYMKTCNETQQWVEGKMSNYDYLMFLNTISGRTFNDSSMYPVFPWISADYTSKERKEITKFRDLSMPIGSFGEARKNEITVRMKDMEQFGQEMFMFAACYSTPLSVFLFNLRMEPFTTLHIQMQSGKFDHAARQFSSIGDAYKMVTSHVNDYRELTPEFFFCPNFLINENGFDLGQINTRTIDNVILPEWAHNDPLTFIYEHRKLLESEYVSNHLNEWIDLIWGSKSRGKAAFDSFNLFDPNMYDEAWDILDQQLENGEITQHDYNSKKSLIEATMANCGQIPPQLFDENHPCKTVESNQQQLTESEIEKELLELPKGAVIELIDKQQKTNILSSVVDFDHELIIVTTELGDVYSVSFNGIKNEILKFDASKVTKRKGKIYTAIFGKKKKDKQQEVKKLIYGTSVGTLICIDLATKVICRINEHCGAVSCLSSSCGGKLIVSGGCDTSIHIYSENLERVFTLSSYRHEITCCTSSYAFNVVVSCTHDGVIYIIDASRNQIFRILQLNDENDEILSFPKNVIITNSWGFIIIYYTKTIKGEEKHFIAVYTINGEKRTNFEIDFPISCITSWTNNKSFDYVMLGSSSTGHIYCFEAFYASKENMKQCAYCYLPVESIEFSYEKNLFVCITRDGKAHLFNASKLQCLY